MCDLASKILTWSVHSLYGCLVKVLVHSLCSLPSNSFLGTLAYLVVYFFLEILVKSISSGIFHQRGTLNPY